MVCSSCGYDNSSEHRYCGMCGTPFPYRPLTVPEAQSTLTFNSAPLEIVPTPIAAEATHIPAPVEPVGPTQVIASAEIAEHPASLVSEAEAYEIPTPLSEPIAFEHAALEHLVAARADAIEPEPPAPESTPALEVAPPPPKTFAETPAPAPPPIQLEQPEPTPHLEEPPPSHISEAHVAGIADNALLVETHSATIEEPPPELVSETEPPAPAAVHEQLPPTPETDKPSPPAPHVVFAPSPARRDYPPPQTQSVPRRPAAPHPSPDSLPITPPPASAGMPTFQEVVEAAGAPPITPFEPQVQKHPDEERELQEYIASFRYTPPAETTDELTMRSEVPVIDKEAPAEFHHASFDDDVPPPPEAGPHPTGEEYYPPAGSAGRSRFLDISDIHLPASSPSSVEHSSTSSMLPLDDAPSRSRRNFWLWSAFFVLLAIFGGLGFLEGRAQSTHAFRGPIEIVRDQYNHLSQRFAKSAEALPAAPTESRTASTAKEHDTGSKPATTEQPPASPPQPEASSNAAPPTTQATTPPAQAQPSPSTSSPASDAAAANTTTNKADTPTPIEAPPAKRSSKVQPGQPELNKAIDASDPAAAAAWLWKSTSRGNSEAPIRLADMYINGHGVPKSCEQALVLLRSAAIKENAPARNRLAALYANGTCVARDRVKAYQLMSSALAADPTSDWAKQNRQELWNQMTPAERAGAQKYR